MPVNQAKAFYQFSAQRSLLLALVLEHQHEILRQNDKEKIEIEGGNRVFRENEI